MQQTIQAFERVLEEERLALHRLDRPAIEAALVRKVQLSEELVAQKGAATRGDMLLLSALDGKIRRNHLLLSHARSCLSGIVSLFQPQESVGYFDAHRPSAAPVRLNLRG